MTVSFDLGHFRGSRPGGERREVAEALGSRRPPLRATSALLDKLEIKSQAHANTLGPHRGEIDIQRQSVLADSTAMLHVNGYGKSISA